MARVVLSNLTSKLAFLVHACSATKCFVVWLPKLPTHKMFQFKQKKKFKKRGKWTWNKENWIILMNYICVGLREQTRKDIVDLLYCNKSSNLGISLVKYHGK